MGLSNVPAAHSGTWHQRLRSRFHGRRVALREWLLEDGANRGLGGPPNKWQSIAARELDNGIGHAEYEARFGDDATTVLLHVRYVDDPDDPGDQGRWLAAIPVVVFRRFALWYLVRWISGEWCGLRRRLYYRWLHRHVARMMAGRHCW